MRGILPILLFGTGILSAADFVARPATIQGYGRSRSSAHFAVFWKDTTAYTMTEAGADSGLANLEKVYDFLVGTLKFPYYPKVSPSTKGNAYIITDGWAFGGGDGDGPGMWLARGAFSDPWALAHEYTHGLQAGTGGFVGTDYVGWIWESHANWMTHQLYPNDAHCSEAYPRTQHLYYGSTRNRYCNWQFLEYLKDSLGTDAVNTLWSTWPAAGTKAWADEDFFRALMRTRGWSQTQLNDVWGRFALRMARYDFKNGAVYRRAWDANRPEEWQRLQRVSLDAVDSSRRRYAIPFDIAPQRFAQNVVRLRREAGRDTLRVRFRGIVQQQSALAQRRPRSEFEPDSFPQPGSDWRWGLVAIDPSGAQPVARYIGPFAGAAGEAEIVARAGETEFYLVVAATPVNRHLIKWDQMHYTIYRYPWMCEVQGGWPDGHQPGAHAAPAGVAGGRHSNGGGFVAATAKVDPTAWVGPKARVLGRAQVLGRARIEGTAVVTEDAVVRDQAVVRGRALVRGSAQVRDSALLEGDAFANAGQIYGGARVADHAGVINAQAKVHGLARLGGSALTWDPCDIGGTAQVLGDGEIRAVTLARGVYYGIVVPEDTAKPAQGATRTAPEPEVTARPTFEWWDPVTTEIERSPTLPALRARRDGGHVTIDGLPAGRVDFAFRDAQGRVLAAGAEHTRHGSVRLKAPGATGWNLLELRAGSWHGTVRGIF